MSILNYFSFSARGRTQHCIAEDMGDIYKFLGRESDPNSLQALGDLRQENHPTIIWGQGDYVDLGPFSIRFSEEQRVYVANHFSSREDFKPQRGLVYLAGLSLNNPLSVSKSIADRVRIIPLQSNPKARQIISDEEILGLIEPEDQEDD